MIQNQLTLSQISWNISSDWPILMTLQLIPLLFAGLILLSRANKQLTKSLAVIAVLAEMVIASWLYKVFDKHDGNMQLAEHFSWLPGYHAAVDGISILFISLTAFLTLLLVLYSIARPLKELGRLFPAILVIQSVLMTLFTTMNLLWFLLFSTIELIISAYLLLHWSTSPERDLARSRYMQFMITGLLLLGVGILMLGWNYSDATDGQWGFDLFDLVQARIPDDIEIVIFVLMFYGLAIRTPIFPLHGWLPIIAVHGNVAVTPVILIGLKVGIYGLIRFVFPLTPDAVIISSPYIVAVAVSGIFYAAILAFMQKNMRRLLAFAVISHTSILTIGLFSLGHTAFQGAVLLSFSFGLATSGLLLMSGFVYSRTGNLLLSRLGGLFDTIPLIGVTFLIAGLSIVGMPGTPGFDAAHLILEASIERFGAVVTIAAALGNVIAAGFLLWAFQRAFLTPSSNKSSTRQTYLQKTQWLERLVAALLIFVLLSTGFNSDPWLDLIDLPLEQLDTLYIQVDS